MATAMATCARLGWRALYRHLRRRQLGAVSQESRRRRASTSAPRGRWPGRPAAGARRPPRRGSTIVDVEGRPGIGDLQPHRRDHRRRRISSRADRAQPGPRAPRPSDAIQRLACHRDAGGRSSSPVTDAKSGRRRFRSIVWQHRRRRRLSRGLRRRLPGDAGRRHRGRPALRQRRCGPELPGAGLPGGAAGRGGGRTAHAGPCYFSVNPRSNPREADRWHHRLHVRSLGPGRRSGRPSRLRIGRCRLLIPVLSNCWTSARWLRLALLSAPAPHRQRHAARYISSAIVRRQPRDASDLSQDVFLRAYRGLRSSGSVDAGDVALSDRRQRLPEPRQREDAGQAVRADRGEAVRRRAPESASG